MLHANVERLKASLVDMAKIGATPGGGVTRTALSDEDREGRNQIVAWLQAANLAVRWDDLGNIYGRLEGSDPSLAPVLMGSHADSVPGGGRFDGIFGVMTALEVARSIRDLGITPRRSIEVVDWTNEEGARFEPAMACSGAVAGRFTPEYIYSRLDRDGKVFVEELVRIGYKGDAANRPQAIQAYFEPHIEQGPVLEAEGIPIGVVTGILGLKWMNVTLHGVQQHAGPSPMRSRHDAMVTAGRIIAGLRDMALEYPDPAVATVGRIKATPGIINQIPGEVVLSADMRHWTGQGHEEMGTKALALIKRLAAEEGVKADVDVFWTCPPIAFPDSMVGLIERTVRDLGVPNRRIVSGAGHDAQYIHEIAPTGMIFVRTIGGKSHCETEDIHWEDAQAAADLLLNAALELAR
ncbi:MAG: Zn-dependent hydrolase [Chloroflexi bacterium]|nr:Zn-dependent hydrolase [Chloroflexota bacterium]